MFRHPNYYKKLRASHVKKAISPDESTDSDGRAPSDKRQASSDKLQATGDKRQASGDKLQASGEAASNKR